jgi:hypothetical protein
MLRKLRPRSIYDVMAAIGCFAALATGTAYAANEWNSSNIQNETLLSEDIKNGTLKAEDYGVGSVSGARIQDNNVTTLDLADGAIFGNDIRNFSFNDEDVGEATAVDLGVTIGSLAANNCVNKTVSGLGAQGDHILVTPAVDDAHGALMYDARYDLASGDMTIHVCNFSSATIDDTTTHFNLLVFGAL